MATKVKKELHFGGLEDKISGFSYFFLLLGIIGLFCCILLEVDISAVSKYAKLWSEIVLGFVSFFGGIAIFIFLQAIAEIIRLLKKQNNLPYGGEISNPTGEKIVWRCSNCNMPIKKLRLLYSRCASCGEPF